MKNIGYIARRKIKQEILAGDAITEEDLKRIPLVLIPILILAAFICVVNIGTEPAKAGTVIPGGSITSNITWTLAGDPYWIQDSVTIVSGVTLTIEPGVMVKFRKDLGMHLYVEGNLVAVGTSSDMIQFTSNESLPAPKDWGNIWVNSTGNAVLDYCNINYGNDAIFLYYASYVKVTNSTVLYNKIGIDLVYATHNTITGNLISKNEISNIFIQDSEDNTFTNNNITLSDQYGLYSQNSINNKIYHNNFIDNWNPQAGDDLNGNFWNDTYPSGGNYWSDWGPITPDLYSGAVTPQTTGSPDGICDNPYNIDVDSIDYYPLKYPFGSPSPDNEPPTIKDINITPDPQEVYDFVNISALVTDNEQVRDVWINITDPNSATIGNFSMNYNVTYDRFYHNATYSLLGPYQFTIFTNDTSGNWNFTSGSFTIEDLTLPLINNVSSDPDFQDVFGNVNVSAIVIDNYNLSDVWVNISLPDGLSTNTTMNQALGIVFYLNQSYDELGVYDFTIWANDTSGNWNFSSGFFEIRDSTPPSIDAVVTNPSTQEVFGSLNISAVVVDNFALYGVWINISKPDGSSINITMKEALGNTFYLNQSYDQLGLYNFTIWANDTSNNWVSASGFFSIKDLGIPQAIAEVSPPYWKNVSTFEIAWTALDDLGLSNVTLLYRYSADNSFWSPWIECSYNNTVSGTSASGSFQFIASAEGYYEFFANASDIGNNWEPDALIAEAVVAVDIASPSSNIDPISLYWVNSPSLTFYASATDGLSGVKDVTLWYRYSTDNVSWVLWEMFETDEIEPWSWVFDFPKGEGYYEFYCIGKDDANNVESKSMGEVICAYDITPPTAYAGEDQVVGPSTTLNFDGTGSSDNFGIIDNYTWTITKDSAAIAILYGSNPMFNFDDVGDYTVTLTVKDPSRNADDDTMAVTVIVELVDLDAPTITHSVVPATQEVYGIVNITAVVTDNVELFDIWVQIFDPENNELENISTNRIGLTDNYWYENTYSIVGIYNYRIWANDTSGNWALANGSFVIQDSTPPIANAGEDLNINLSDTVHFDGSASTDNVGIINYTWNITKNGALIVTLYEINPSYRFEERGNYDVTLIVKDAAGNTDTDIIIVRVTPEKRSDTDYFWLLLLIIILIIVVIIILLARRKKKKPAELEQETPIQPDLPSRTVPLTEELPLSPLEGEEE